MNDGSFRIARVAAAAVRPLRSAVLRPGTPPDTLVYDGDDAVDALHVAAVDAGEQVLGIASLCREAAANEPLPVDGWRLRGMATAPEVRGSGLGSLLLEACFRHVRAHGGGLLWCNAREIAVGFYERNGLETIGPRFDIAGIGPHFVMRRLLPCLRPSITAAAHATSRLRRVATVTERQREHVVGFHELEALARGEWRLDALFVEPTWRRRGIGRDLLANARETVAERGGSSLSVESAPGTDAFFERNGGERIGDAPPRFRFAIR